MGRLPQRGFTLIEVMIAVSITAVIGAMTLGAFQRTQALRQAVEEQDERISGARTALSRMAREVAGAYVSEHYDRRRYRDRPTLFRGKDGGGRDDILFATMDHVRGLRDSKESDQMVVEYLLESDPAESGGYVLVRREKIRIDAEPDRGGTQAELLRHVTGFTAAYWDWQKQEWDKEWTTAPGNRPLLPTRVRLKLTLRMPDGGEKSFETQARIAVIRPLDF